MSAWILAAILASVPLADVAQGAEVNDASLHLVSGTLSKLDLSNGRGLLTTDLGRPIYFDVPKAYLFENVTVGARIALRLDEYGRALRVMDTSIADFVMTPARLEAGQPLTANLQDAPDRQDILDR
ncbi:MAG TPA: hypothetical protein VIU63_06265 [Nitrospira sp.]